MESCNEFSSLESLKQKFIEKAARQYDWSAKCNTDNNVLQSKNHFDRNNDSHNSAKTKVNKFNGKCFNYSKNSHISQFSKSNQRQNELCDIDDTMIAIACNAELMKNNKHGL